MIEEINKNQWWNEVSQEGLFISQPVLEEVFPNGPTNLKDFVYEDLRNHYQLFKGSLDLIDHKLYNSRRRDWIL
ncbi:MAG: hypothetical protein OEZ01_08495, partial [Candidatus Heimdallarchaeota archaeon]|nr:hypothetical protein [Candidatus Heimdallarchaeota archaeon]